jgi:TonB family protein
VIRRRTAALAAAIGMVLAGRAAAQPPPPAQPDQLDASTLSKLPVQTKFALADYPPEARARGVEAEVVLVLDIDQTGAVTQVGIAEPADPPDLGFDEAAMVAAKQFEFEPAELDGTPIAVQITYRYRFTLATDPAPPAAGQPPDRGAPAPAPAPARRTKPVVNFAGVLLQRGTRLPMPGVVVTVFREDPAAGPVGFEAASDADGRFAFYDLAPGEWRILIEPPGHYPFRTTEVIQAGQRVDVTFYLEKASYNPYDVTVTAERPRKEVSRTAIAADEIDKVPGGAGDPLAVIRNFAGVARTEPEDGLLVVRGSAPADSHVLFDGMEVPLLYHFGGVKSVIPIGMLDSIEFYPGNFSPMYGRATGGIVDVKIKQLVPDKVGGYADVSILDAGGYLEVPLGKRAAVAVAGRRSYIDGILNLAVPDDAAVSLLTAPVYYDAQVLGNYRPAPAHDLRGLFLLSDDRLELLFRNPADVDPALEGNTISAKTNFYRSLLTYRYVPDEALENTLRLSLGRDRFLFGAGQLTFDLELYTAQLRDTVRHKLGRHVAVSYGADLKVEQGSAFIRLPRAPSEGQPGGGDLDLSDVRTTQIDGQVVWSPGAFLEAELRPIPQLLILPGLRADYFQLVDEASVQPRLTARWQLADPVTAKGGAGLFVQPPPFERVETSFGNPDLGTERTMHYSFGAELASSSWLKFDATGFYKHMWHLVSPTDRLRMGEGGELEPLFYDDRGTGRVYGLELVARHELHRNLTGWVAYTLSRALRRDSGAMEDRLFDFDQTHILTAVASYLLPRNWLVGGRFRLVTGNPTTPVVGSVYDASSDQYDPIYGRVNTARTRDFHQLDLRVDKRWIYRNWILNAYVDIQNVYNRSNTEWVDFNFDYSESKEQGGVPLLTIIGLRAEF